MPSERRSSVAAHPRSGGAAPIMSFVFHVVTDPVVAWLVVIWLSATEPPVHVWDLVVVIASQVTTGVSSKLKWAAET